MFRTRNVVQGFLLSGLAAGAGAQSAYKVLDIYPGPQGSYPGAFVRSGDVTFFSADDPAHGRELWRSDGTAAGTVLVKDIIAGPNSASPTSLTDVAGTLFFRISGGSGNVLGDQLWKSDGTAAGTVQVVQLAPSGSNANANGFTAVGGALMFSASAGGAGQELWRSDGTAAGTVLVKDIAPGAASSSPDGITAFGAGVVFSAQVPGQGVELWKSDGTAAGTVQVADIEPGSGSSSPSTAKVVSGGHVYFAATRTGSGTEPWVSDGTAAGTRLLADLHPDAPSSNPERFRVSNDVVYFRAYEQATGVEPYRTDGTTAGTVRLADINPGFIGSYPEGFLSLGAQTIFNAQDHTTVGYELYRTDGTEAGTFVVSAVDPGPQGHTPAFLARFEGRIYFTAEDAVSGYNLWGTDGTEEGTRLVPDVHWGPGSPMPISAFAAPGTLLFRGEDAELWAVIDGTPKADAGPDQTVADGESVTLDGSASMDPHGDPLTFEWRDASGTVLATTIAFTSTFPRGIHEVTLVVSDGVNTGTDTVRVRVGRILDVVLVGDANAGGTVTAVPGGTCQLAGGGSTTCAFAYEDGQAVELTATPAPGATFGAWEGACSGAGPCSLAMTESQVVTARFVPAPQRTLLVEVKSQGNGLGSVRIDPPGDLCILTTPDSSHLCERSYTQGDTVVLTALPAPGSVFVGWSDPDCPGTGTCTVSMDLDVWVQAIFLGPRRLLVEVKSQGNGLGSVRIDPPGELCTLTTPDSSQFCQRFYTLGDMVVLTALPAPGSVFVGWSDPDCPGTGTCTVSMDSDLWVQGIFLGPRELLVEVTSQGNGLGSVRIDPPGELCTLTTPGGSQFCERLYTLGDAVVLTALPAPGSAFVGWSDPDCPGTGTCTISMASDLWVQAIFLGPRRLLVEVEGQENGLGSVRIDPPGELCTLTTPGGNQYCQRYYTQGDTVVLTALPAPGSVFVAWDDPACPGTGTCTVTMDDHQYVQATFLGPRTLDVAVIATRDAAGAVRIDPPGTLCPVTTGAPNHCVETYAPGTVVVLTALPGPGTTFDGFGPPCTGGTACTLTLTAASTVVPASFSRANQPPAVALTAPAPGAVIPPAASVTLTASAADADGSVTLVEFFVNGREVGESTTAPWATVWTPVAPGAYTLTARAIDDDGAATDSVPVPVVVNAPPAITMVSPLPGTPFVAPATVTLAADATDPDGAIALVEFFEGAVSLGSDTTSPYSVVWPSVAAGSHALTAVATDDRGATTSVPFTVVVSAREVSSADGHVRDGKHAGTNYGGSPTLEVRSSGSAGDTRHTYLRFPIAALSTVSAARLRLYGGLTETTGGPVEAQVLAVTSTSWFEDRFTWDSRPTTQPVPLATTALDHTSTAERWYEWDVTAYVQAEKAAGRTVVSFAVVEPAHAPLAVFRARTSVARVQRPELVLVP